MRPDPAAQPDYVAAFEEIAKRIAESLSETPENRLPVRMFVAGGAAVHFYTGDRISIRIDATFSHRMVLPDDLEVSYRAPDGAAQLLYLNRQYNASFSLMHEEACDDAVPLELYGIDPGILDIRLLSARDLAVSKISRFSDQDREDIASLAKRGLIDSDVLRNRAGYAAMRYVGNLENLQTSIKLACNLVDDVEARMERRLAIN